MLLRPCRLLFELGMISGEGDRVGGNKREGERREGKVGEERKGSEFSSRI